MNKKTVLVVDDSIDALMLVKRAIESVADLEFAKSVKEALGVLNQKTIDLILLDVNLPDGEGFHLASLIRSSDPHSRIPIIFLTARTSVSDAVFALSSGGDDFMSKPFNAEELKARVSSYLRKAIKVQRDADLIRAGKIEIDKDSGTVFILNADAREEVRVTRIEFKILVLLASNENKEFSRDQILDFVWGESTHVFSRSVDTHVSKLRKALGGLAHYICSVHGHGYVLRTNQP